jgi:hypothetical protein
MNEHDDFVNEDGVWVDRSDQVDPEPRVISARTGDHIDRSGTWVGGDSPETHQPPRAIEGRDEKQNKHIRDMQRNVLIGIGSLITLTLLCIVITVSAKWMTEVFAKEILQVVLAPLLAAAAVVVGYFFGQRN